MALLTNPLTPEEQHQKDLETLEKLRILDDTLMREVFRNNLELAQFMLRIIIGKRQNQQFRNMLFDITHICEQHQHHRI